MGAEGSAASSSEPRVGHAAAALGRSGDTERGSDSGSTTEPSAGVGQPSVGSAAGPAAAYVNHPATFQVWHWLSGPASSHLTPEERERCEDAARTIDRIFFEWEADKRAS